MILILISLLYDWLCHKFIKYHFATVLFSWVFSSNECIVPLSLCGGCYFALFIYKITIFKKEDLTERVRIYQNFSTITLILSFEPFILAYFTKVMAIVLAF